MLISGFVPFHPGQERNEVEKNAIRPRATCDLLPDDSRGYIVRKRVVLMLPRVTLTRRDNHHDNCGVKTAIRVAFITDKKHCRRSNGKKAASAKKEGKGRKVRHNNRQRTIALAYFRGSRILFPEGPETAVMHSVVILAVMVDLFLS